MHPFHLSQFQVVAIVAVVLAAIGLSSCSGYTNASSSTSPPHTQTGNSGVLSAGSTSVTFGSVSVGGTTTQSLSVTNTGTTTVSVSGATISGAGFTLVAGNAASSIAVGQSATVQIQFAPQSAGAATGNLTVVSDAADSPLTVSLNGTGMQAGLSITPSSVSFGSVADGTSNSQTITLKNAGNMSLTISQDSVTGTGFSITGLSAQTLSPGASTTFNAAFAPTSAGSVTGSIYLTTNAPGSPATIALSGTGAIATHTLSANPTSLSFGSVNLGSSSSLGVTLTNNGNSNITISGVSASNNAFGTSGSGSGTILTPGQSTTLTVLFTPAGTGSASGTVTVASNATTAPTISVSGTGAQATSHSVLLSWAASTSTGVAGYNVYQGTVSGGPYAKLTSTLVLASSLQYADTTVQSGHTYYYVVTTVDSSNDESGYSNQVSAAVP